MYVIYDSLSYLKFPIENCFPTTTGVYLQYLLNRMNQLIRVTITLENGLIRSYHFTNTQYKTKQDGKLENAGYYHHNENLEYIPGDKARNKTRMDFINSSHRKI